MHKLALITGASSGLGKTLSQFLAKRGVALILVARDLKALEALAQELPASTQIHKCDLSLTEERLALIQLIHKLTPDLVINNAGFGLYGPILSHPLSRFQEMVSVNAQAVMELSIESARALQNKKQKGTILNISSAAAFFPYPTFCIYAATKAFVNHFSQGFDEEMKPYGIRILTVCPGQIDTPFRKKASHGLSQGTDRYTLSQNTAVKLILKQIDTGKQIQIIDWRYRLGVALGKILPKKWREAILINSLTSRYTIS
jgi:uncharacterized protein